MSTSSSVWTWASGCKVGLQAYDERTSAVLEKNYQRDGNKAVTTFRYGAHSFLRVYFK